MAPQLPSISLADYHYDLPEERIANFPLEKRDSSKLLHYNGTINHQTFHELPGLLPSGSLLVFNDTRVIPARLVFYRETGARIEVLLLKPVFPKEMVQMMGTREFCSWSCMIGNKKKWKDGEVLTMNVETEDLHLRLYAKLIDREQQWVELSWKQSSITFSKLIGAIGDMPLPPYIKRATVETDKEKYQTVYARVEGAVAAPTAGLHFTDTVLEKLREKDVLTDFVTLHVGAGTFLPVKQDDATAHAMHAERIFFTVKNLEHILSRIDNVIAVGTTSMRVLESAYWMGVKILTGQSGADLTITQEYAYSHGDSTLPTAQESMQALVTYMKTKNLEFISANTSIYILPGYTFRMCKGLVTNFHLPETTLILLVAAFIGEDWKKVYEAALQQGYRFLSYGDSSLLWGAA